MIYKIFQASSRSFKPSFAELITTTMTCLGPKSSLSFPTAPLSPLGYHSQLLPFFTTLSKALVPIFWSTGFLCNSLISWHETVVLESESLEEQDSCVRDKIFLHPWFVSPKITFSFPPPKLSFLKLFVIFIILAKRSSLTSSVLSFKIELKGAHF